MMKSIINDARILENKKNLVLLKDVGKYTPVEISASTAQRWARGLGTGGIVLATAKLGGRRYTNENAIQAFFAMQQDPQQAHGTASIIPVMITPQEIEANRARYSLPKPRESASEN